MDHVALSLSHTAGSSHHDNGADEPESASKRRRRSEDRDVAEASLDAVGAPAANPVNGHSLEEANGGVPPEAAFWSALEDAKDEVRIPTSASIFFLAPCLSIFLLLLLPGLPALLLPQ